MVYVVRVSEVSYCRVHVVGLGLGTLSLKGLGFRILVDFKFRLGSRLF